MDYFQAFLQLKPKGTIDQSHVRFLTPGRDVGINSGIYTFNIVKEGKAQHVRGRRTLLVPDGSWPATL